MVKKYYFILALFIITITAFADPLKVIEEKDNRIVIEYVSNIDYIIQKKNVNLSELYEKQPQPQYFS